MTIGVIPAYRRRGIGNSTIFYSHLFNFYALATKLLNHVLENAANDPTVLEVYLHVQIK
jgi:GNAT superfamily N-acetyltransferase